MARSTKSYEERLLQLEKREQESLEKAKQYAAQKRELKKRQKDVETKKLDNRNQVKIKKISMIFHGFYCALKIPEEKALFFRVV